jgi:hypothetical protein
MRAVYALGVSDVTHLRVETAIRHPAIATVMGTGLASRYG